jgi:CrcB protein
MTPSVLALVAVGGAVGSALRYFATGDSPGIPWAILAVNLAGAVVAGFIVGRIPVHSHRARVLLPLAVVGVAGALTTFSGLVLDTVLLIDAGHVSDAVRYAGASVVAGPVAAAGGLWAGGRR